jgi:hypothetical protein
MMKFTINIPSLAAFVVILGASCSAPKPEPHDAPEFYDLSVYEEAKVGDILEVAEVVPLLFERDTYPKYPYIVSFLGDTLIIEELDRMVHVFAPDGHYIGCSNDMKGNGPGEYVTHIGHTVNPFNNTVDIMTFRSMHSYDPELTHCVNESKLPTSITETSSWLYDEGIALSESKYLLHSRTATTPYKVTLYDAESGTALNTWSYADDVLSYFGGGRQRFFKMPDGEILLVPTAFTPYIYGVDSDGRDMYKTIEFKYGDKIIKDHVTLDDFYKNTNIWKEYYENPSIEIPFDRLVNSKKIVTIIEVGPDYSRDRYLLLTDRGSGHTYRVESTEDDNVIFPKLFYIDENYLYNILTKEHILENPRCFLNKESEADSLLASIDDEDFVLIKYRFKK